MARVYFRPKKSLRKTARAKRIAPDNGTWWIDYRATDGRRQEKTEARSKEEAEATLREVLVRGERLRRGLEARTEPVTFSRAAFLYRPSVKHLASYEDIDAQLRLHIEPVLGKKLLTEITPADCDHVISKLRGELAPASLKGLLIRIGAVYRWATRRGRIYYGPNPVHEARRVEVPEHAPRFLTEEQLTQLLAAMGADRDIHLFAVMTGLRKGEVAGLQWTDLDFERGVITVRRSYDRASTKGRKDRLIPIHAILLPLLLRRRKESKSVYVFPGPGEKMRTDDGWDAAENFKAALRKAGLVSGYLHKCRRGRPVKCGHRVTAADAEKRKCPKCGFVMWPTGVPLEFTFKDLRSTYATHLAMASGDIRLVQRLLGHSRPEITERAYAATTLEYLRRGIESLPLGRDKDGTREVAGERVSARLLKKGEQND